MFGLENKFNNWIEKKEEKWIHEISDPYIPKIEKALSNFDKNWYVKISKLEMIYKN